MPSSFQNLLDRFGLEIDINIHVDRKFHPSGTMKITRPGRTRNDRASNELKTERERLRTPPRLAQEEKRKTQGYYDQGHSPRRGRYPTIKPSVTKIHRQGEERTRLEGRRVFEGGYVGCRDEKGRCWEGCYLNDRNDKDLRVGVRREGRHVAVGVSISQRGGRDGGPAVPAPKPPRRGDSGVLGGEPTPIMPEKGPLYNRYRPLYDKKHSVTLDGEDSEDACSHASTNSSASGSSFCSLDSDDDSASCNSV